MSAERPDWLDESPCLSEAERAGLELAHREFVETGMAEWEPTDGLLDWAVLAYYKQGGPCPYRSHRSSDWLNDAQQWVCGICHPLADSPGRKASR